mmetsp:Transcript_9210/g.13868  ORF Transcript_9210/g.13868 Transcript_9210/m.13868 type:complete len:206 (-) Transcript_9210:725-1342(-)
MTGGTVPTLGDCVVSLKPKSSPTSKPSSQFSSSSCGTVTSSVEGVPIDVGISVVGGLSASATPLSADDVRGPSLILSMERVLTVTVPRPIAEGFRRPSPSKSSGRISWGPAPVDGAGSKFLRKAVTLLPCAVSADLPPWSRVDGRCSCRWDRASPVVLSSKSSSQLSSSSSSPSSLRTFELLGSVSRPTLLSESKPDISNSSSSP